MDDPIWKEFVHRTTQRGSEVGIPENSADIAGCVRNRPRRHFAAEQATVWLDRTGHVERLTLTQGQVGIEVR